MKTVQWNRKSNYIGNW